MTNNFTIKISFEVYVQVFGGEIALANVTAIRFSNSTNSVQMRLSTNMAVQQRRTKLTELHVVTWRTCR